MAEQSKCPICSHKAEPFGNYRGGGYELDCVRCGKFKIGNIASGQISLWSLPKRINLSGWIRENQYCEIASSNLERFENLRDLTVGEKAEKILLQLAKTFPKPGEFLDLCNGADLEFKAVGRVTDDEELCFLMQEYLHGEKQFIIFTRSGTGLSAIQSYKISPKGWSYLDSLRHGNPTSQIGFIAMWFDKVVNDSHLAIHEGINAAGYEPLRVDGKEHNNKIDDEIVAGIRRSKFLVADFTGHRGGVYFEAGLATGLGLPVIWLCRKDELEKTHFDTRQYNFIVWEADKLGELSKALKNRIEATIGHGPLQSAT
jgi:hypothetical protein